jgi:hypothetical protein
VADGSRESNPGDGLLNASFAGTGALVGTSIVGAAFPDSFSIVHALLSLVLFAIGAGALFWGYAIGVSRSRTHLVNLPGLFFLGAGAAPPEVARRFRIALGVEIVVVLAAALARPDSNMPFGVLAPVFVLGLMSVWGGRFGAFEARADAPADRDRP